MPLVSTCSLVPPLSHSLAHSRSLTCCPSAHEQFPFLGWHTPAFAVLSSPSSCHPGHSTHSPPGHAGLSEGFDKRTVITHSLPHAWRRFTPSSRPEIPWGNCCTSTIGSLAEPTVISGYSVHGEALVSCFPIFSFEFVRKPSILRPTDSYSV